MYADQDIAILAREYMALGEFKSHWAIQRQLARSIAGADWDEMRKWYRVKLAMRRLAPSHSAGERSFAIDAQRARSSAARMQSAAI